MISELSVKERALQEAIRFGDKILAAADRQDDGWSWPTLEQDFGGNKAKKWYTHYNLYNGTGGICIYLISLYEVTRQEKYLEGARQGVSWILNKNHPEHYSSYALYTGASGIIFLLVRMYQVTSDRGYLDSALPFAIASRPFMSVGLNELISGISGTLMALLHLHQYLDNNDLLKVIHRYVEQLVTNMKSGVNGICWDRLPSYQHALCGLSHGVSGPSFVFSELGYYFKNPAFFELAYQAMQYENQFFAKEELNWKDLRNRTMIQNSEPLYKEAYHKADVSFFTEQNFMNAWCHGAAGIGMARSNLFHRTGNPSLLTDLSDAISKTIESDIECFNEMLLTLCHGSAGNAELFLEAAEILEHEKHMTMANAVVDNILNYGSRTGRYFDNTRYSDENYSLFLGLSGIGYLCLRLSAPQIVPSILVPKLIKQNTAEIKDFPFLILSHADIHSKLIDVDFHRSLYLVQQLMPQALANYIALPVPTDIKKSWQKFIEQSLMVLVDKERELLKEIYLLEEAKVMINDTVKSDNLLSFKDKQKKRGVKKALDDSTFESTLFCIDNDYSVFKCSHDWSATKEIWQERSENTFYFLLRPTLNGVAEQKLSEFSFLLLSCFEKPVLVNEVINQMLEYFNSPPDQLVNLVSSQVREMIRATFLLSYSEHPINPRCYPFILNKILN
jgi:hypothetical protein